MSKQTINIGASPNDGTGTPLRTSFDYCNQNFTELYTATGPSGNNIVVPGNATITGDLTVDTSTLKVDSTNDRVGVGVASPAAGAKLSVLGTTVVSASDFVNASTWSARFQAAANSQPSGIFLSGLASGGQVVPGSLHVEPVAASSRSALIATYSADSGVGYFAINRFSPSAGTTSEHYKIDNAGVATWSNVGGVAGTAMTLNSTGLGIGASPSRKLSVSGAAAGLDVTDTTQSTRLRIRSSSASNFFIEALNSAESAYVTLRLNDTTQIDSSGNVGIGVTPSAWGGSYKSVQVNEAGGFAGKNDGLIVAQNCYFDGTNWVNNRASTFSSRYDMNVAGNGIHAWYVYNASFGTVGNTIPFTQAMTLDASGYLLLGTTDTTFTSGAGYKFGPGATPSNGQVGASSSNGDLTLRVYSTGAAAYRFYVGFGGTVFATSATISAISDARLKENVQNLDVGLNEILALKPRKFDWKAGKGKDIKGDRGFIAQEFETVFPNLIDEWADPAPEGEAPYKSVRQDLIPVLVKAIQELTARVQTLETR